MNFKFSIEIDSDDSDDIERVLIGQVRAIDERIEAIKRKRSWLAIERQATIEALERDRRFLYGLQHAIAQAHGIAHRDARMKGQG